MTEPNPDLDERLARLAARKAGAKSSASTAASSTTDAPAPVRTRRKHPAAAARILSLGLSSSAFFSIIGAFGQQTPHASSAAAARPRPIAPIALAPVRTKVVVKYVHHPLYVDQYGRPVPVPVLAATVASGAASAPTGSRTGPAPSWAAAPASGVPAAGVPAATPAATPPAPGRPVAAPAVTPPPTTPPAPAPRPTTPPPTVVTTPPPPPPPACSGTKCP